MKIATWNVNSIRTRQDHVVQWLQMNPVDVLCLQETKVIDQGFPQQPFLDLGYHVYKSGQKAYNGVALLSRSPLSQVQCGFTPILGSDQVQTFDEQKRLISGVINDIFLICVYVPNGAEIDSEKYHYKLHWLKLLKAYLQKILDQFPLLCICGDFNIAPDDRDVYDPQACAGKVGVSSVERQALQDILTVGLADAFRKFEPGGNHFSWWDYRGRSFPQNHGWRIDHHYLSPKLYEQAVSCTIDPAPRTWLKPSDHTPVIVEF